MGETRFKEISTYLTHHAIDEEGNLWAWGRNVYLTLGDGTTTNKTSPVQIKEGTKFKKVVDGNSLAGAIDEEGNMWVWGFNTSGALGDGTKANRPSPILFKEGIKFKDIAVEAGTIYGLDTSGKCWYATDKGYFEKCLD